MNQFFFCERAAPEQMDALWAEGWRHFGCYFFRYDRLEQAGRTFTVLPLRLPLSDFGPSKSQRRILKRNEDLTIRVLPAFVNEAALDLFERHKTRFQTNVPESLFTFISEQPDRAPCPCLSLCLYHRDELVGLSYLDVGKRACSSVYQMFEPDEEKRSLGVLMILLAIRLSAEMGKSLYYPGYAYVEPSHYDYKKKFKGLYGYDWAGNWQPLPRSR